MKAFVFMPYNPGDVVMALHAAKTLHDARPDCRIDFITSEECADLARALPWLHRVIALPRKGLSHDMHLAAQALAERLGEKNEERNEERNAQVAEPVARPEVGYDLGINLFQAKWGAYLAGYLGAKTKIGLWPEPGAGVRLHGPLLEYWMAQPVDRKSVSWHTIDFFRKTILAVLTEATIQTPSKKPSPQHPAIELLFPRVRPNPDGIQGPGTKPWHVVLHPGSAWPGKRWPFTSWVALAKQLLEAGHLLSVTGSSEEQGWIAGMLADPTLAKASQTPSEANPDRGAPFRLNIKAGHTTWQDLISLYQKTNWVVSGDTVAMHVGAACGARTLSLFGASNPRETGPYGPGHFIFECAPLPYAAELDFAHSHAGLEALSAKTVAAFMLQGQTPENANLPARDASPRLWETYWLPQVGTQVLRDACGRVDPLALGDFVHQVALGHQAGLGTGSLSDDRVARLPPLLHRLDQALQAAIAEGEGIARHPEKLAALSQAEADWSHASARNLSFEAYRIAVNGLPLRPLARHLTLRQVRLRQAIAEFLQSTIAEGMLQKAQ